MFANRILFANRSVRKVPRCYMPLCEAEVTTEESESAEKNGDSVEEELP